MTYKVFIDDNFHYGDETERYPHGTFETLDAAIAAAKAVVDDYLENATKQGITPDGLLESYLLFGEDPFIISTDDSESGVLFSARDYARLRCGQLEEQGRAHAIDHWSTNSPVNRPPWSLRRVHAVDSATLSGLADVLIDCVEGGASVSFMLPLTRERALAFWKIVADGVADGERALLVAEDERGVCGTVQLILAQPENQPHRADLSKMLVHRRARRHGVGSALMRGAQAMALECGKTLLVLDTASADAERLYEREGWVRVGAVPGFALLPDGRPCDTVFYYLVVRGADSNSTSK